MSAQDNQYSYRVGVRLAEYRVEEASARRTLRGDARWTAHFYLVRRNKRTTFTLYARTEDCRRKWLKAIRDAMSVSPGTVHAHVHALAALIPRASQQTHHLHAVRAHRRLPLQVAQGHKRRHVSEPWHCSRTRTRTRTRSRTRTRTSCTYTSCVATNAPPFYASTDGCRRKWLKAILDAIDNLEPAGCRSTNHKFVLHTFEKPATCHHCSKFLKGRIFQGYLCSVCNACAHKDCIALSGRCGGGIAPAPPLPPHTHQPDQALHYYMWYVGEMGRETATARLERRVDGTFLLRIRPRAALHSPTDTHYALSLKTDNTVKHMRVCRKPIDQVPHYYLSESRFFRSVVELVSYYEMTSLSENFVGLNSKLRWPFRRVVATVVHDFRPLEASQLALRPGAKLLVLSKEGDSRGWWKGRTLDKDDNRSGYFPKECVREDPECIGALD
ncbi:unnamed protein product [Parnassius apollo]|uniref:(apollo) hypothetical protein n=1 Tax=Parnassius apollo TaxID=110799 RepID=A0A8S3XNV1_PARAO|nr:unnamed protein product [Parnassius apollo]